jgi:hypothetical protein
VGEKQIIPGGGTGTPGTGTPGGGTTGGGSGPGGLSTTPAGGGTIPTQTRPPTTTQTPTTEADLCSDIKRKQAAKLDELEGVARANRAATERAMQAFYGPKGSAGTADGYAHWCTQAKVTEAVVDTQNAVGKNLIDAALFAAGGWGGIASSTGAVEAEGALGGFAGFAEGAFGKGMAGAKDVADAYGKIAVKVAEKIGDAAADYKAGKAGSSLAKSIEKLGGEHPDDWIQGPFGYLESVARGKLIDALGDWMKEGAMAGDLDRAKQAYLDFCLAAQTANIAAAAADQIKAALEALNEEAKKRGCPQVAIPDWNLYTIDPAVFGAGPEVGSTGPSAIRHSLESGKNVQFDLFGSIAGGAYTSLPGM